MSDTKFTAILIACFLVIFFLSAVVSWIIWKCLKKTRQRQQIIDLSEKLQCDFSVQESEPNIVITKHMIDEIDENV
jgi:hypothetical protein